MCDVFVRIWCEFCEFLISESHQQICAFQRLPLVQYVDARLKVLVSFRAAVYAGSLWCEINLPLGIHISVSLQ